MMEIYRTYARYHANENLIELDHTGNPDSLEEVWTLIQRYSTEGPVPEEAVSSGWFLVEVIL